MAIGPRIQITEGCLFTMSTGAGIYIMYVPHSLTINSFFIGILGVDDVQTLLLECDMGNYSTRSMNQLMNNLVHTCAVFSNIGRKMKNKRIA